MGWLICGCLMFLAGCAAPSLVRAISNNPEASWAGRYGALAACWMIALALFASTSFVYVGNDETGHLAKVYAGGDLKDGRIIATNGEKGPQAEIMPPGFHFEPFLNVVYAFEKKGVVNVPEGKYGYLVAKDGEPLREGQTFADPFKSGKLMEMLDAKNFLTKGGQKGPQSSILPPGTYRLNNYLWDVTFDEATEIPKGKVGVVKSNVWGSVNIGNLTAEKPEHPVEIAKQEDGERRLAVPLVKVGCVGIWAEALNPGLYYVNKKAFQLTLIETHLQTWEYKGGYSRRRIDLKVDQQGGITQTETTEKVEVANGAADAAVFVKMEGWDVPQELRVLVQITPANAPFVAASVGGVKEVADKVLTPAIRSIVRNICGGAIKVPDSTGKLVERPTRVLDLIENRVILEAGVEAVINREGMKAGVDVKEVRFGEAAIPPEFLVTRLREQLAQQLGKAYKEEEKAQQERIAKENARAKADQQDKLIEAEIEVQRSQKLAEARKNEGQGEKDKLSLIAEGQKTQVAVLGDTKVVELRKYELMVDRAFKLFEAHPEILTAALSNAHKFVPERVFNVNGAGAGNAGNLLAGAGILGDYIGGNVPTAVQSTDQGGNGATPPKK